MARQVADDLKRGFNPTDLLITGVHGENDREHLNKLSEELHRHQVKTWLPGEDTSTDFRRPGHVTLANIYRAKGNEAWKVYATRMHYATEPQKWKNETELHKRNEAFVALTRARVWCVATGKDGPLFEELRRAIATAPEIVFPAFNRRSLVRDTDENIESE